MDEDGIRCSCGGEILPAVLDVTAREAALVDYCGECGKLTGFVRVPREVAA